MILFFKMFNRITSSFSRQLTAAAEELRYVLMANSYGWKKKAQNIFDQAQENQGSTA